MTDDLYDGFAHLLFDRPAPHVVRITINNPAQMNAIGTSLSNELQRVWRVIDRDPEARVSIITGAGRAFSAGGAMDDMPTDAAPDPQTQFCEGFGHARGLVAALVEARKPIVSAINGPAVGAGLAVALLADVSIAATTAKLFEGHLRIGVVPGDHAALIWPLLCGMAKAKFHLMTNTPLTGAEAERCNLVSLAVEPEALQDHAVAVAVSLAAVAPTALAMTKYVLNHWLRQNQPLLDLSAAFEMVNFTGRESSEAMRAYAAKEPPRFDTPSAFR